MSTPVFILFPAYPPFYLSEFKASAVGWGFVGDYVPLLNMQTLASVLRFLAGSAGRSPASLIREFNVVSCAPRAGGTLPRPPHCHLITGGLSVMKESRENWRSFSPLPGALTRHKALIRRGGDSGDEVGDERGCTRSHTPGG